MKTYWGDLGHGNDAVEALSRIFSAFLPHSQRVFKDDYGPLRLLHQNGNVVEKAFVFGVIALSKWLGAERFPQGIYGEWPPSRPSTGSQPTTGVIVDLSNME